MIGRRKKKKKNHNEVNEINNVNIRRDFVALAALKFIHAPISCKRFDESNVSVNEMSRETISLVTDVFRFLIDDRTHVSDRLQCSCTQ